MTTEVVCNLTRNLNWPPTITCQRFIEVEVESKILKHIKRDGELLNLRGHIKNRQVSGKMSPNIGT